MVKTCLKTSRRRVLPSLPVVVFRLIKVTEDETRSLINLAELAGKDPALSSQILKLANSPLMNTGRPVRSLSQAALNLGTSTIRNLAITVAVCQSFARLEVPGNFSISAFWNHSLSCAIIAKLLAEHSMDTAPEEAFVAGLLHDIGQLALVVRDPDKFEKIVQNPHTGQTILESERQAWGLDHAQEGYRLLKDWGIHQNILDCVRYHHRDAKEIALSSEVVRIVFLADLFSHFGSGGSSLDIQQFYQMLDQFALKAGPEGLEGLLKRARSEIKTASNELGLNVATSKAEAKIPRIDARAKEDQVLLADKALDLAVLTGTLDSLLAVSSQDQLKSQIFSSIGILTDSQTAIFFLKKKQSLVGLYAKGTRDDSLVNQIHILGLDDSIWEEAFRTALPIHSHLFFKRHKMRIIDEQIRDYVGGDFLVVPVFAWGRAEGALVLSMSWDSWVELEPGKELLMLLARQIGHVYEGLRYRRLWEKEHLINDIIVKKSSVGIVLTTYSGETISCNPSARAFLGINGTGFRDLNIFDFLGLDDKNTNSLLGEVTPGKSQNLGRFRIDVQDNRPVWLEVEVAPVSISGLDRLLFLIRDVTAEVALDLERKNRAIWLEKELTKKTEELRKAQEKLIQAERLGATSQLARKVVHEVNNPLGIIKNFLKILKIQKETGEIDDKTIDAISSEIDRVARLLRQLGNFASAQHGQDMSGSASIDSVVRELELLMKKTLAEKGVSLETEIEKGLPSVKMSPDNLKQVLVNLIKNADEALEGPGRILVRAFQQDGDSKYVLLEVADTGPGIPKQIREKVFDPFTTTKGADNAGLGLSVCYGLVNACGGEIILSQEEGFNTVVRIRLPIALG